MKQYVIYILLNIVNSTAYDDSTKQIAKSILLNMNLIKDLSLEDCANFLHISISTLNRFCKKIGFYNYSTFREDIKDDNPEQQIKDFFCHHELPLNTNELMLCLQHIDTLKLNNIISYLYRAKHIYFLGLDFQFQFMHFQEGMMLKKKFVEFCPPFGKLPDMNKDDVFILYSMNGATLKSYRNQIETLKGKRVWITQLLDKSNDNLFNEIIRFRSTDIHSIHKYEFSYLMDLILCEYDQYCSKFEQ